MKKAPMYVMVRLKDMEVLGYTTDLGAAIDFVNAQKSEGIECVIYERLSKKTWEPQENE